MPPTPDTSRQMITKTSTQHSVLVSVIVKADSKEAAEKFVTERLDDWFNEPRSEVPLKNGDLLGWNFYEPRVINGWGLDGR